MMEYRVDFLIGALSILFIQTTSILFVKIVFDHIHTLQGWTFHEVLFIYGIAATGRSIHQFFFENLWVLGSAYIRTGNFDRILLRPIPPLFHLIADRIQPDGIGQLIIGVIVLGIAIPELSMPWGGLETLILALLILSSGLIFIAVNLFFATFSFWMVDSFPIMSTTYQLSSFTNYPLTIYNKGLRFVLTWIIPYGFTSFYPAAVFVDQGGYHTVGYLTPVVAILCCMIAYFFWKRGLRSFASTGH